MSSPTGKFSLTVRPAYVCVIVVIAIALLPAIQASAAGASPSVSASGSVTAQDSSGNGSVTLNWGDSNTETFSYTGSAQSFTVPDGVFQMQASAAGGNGGNSPNFGATGSIAGGTGATETGTIYVEPQETLYIYVGGVGQDAQNVPCTTDSTTTVYSDGGFNGGGDGGFTSAGATGAGGGGASDVQTVASTSTEPETSSWLIGGGGGGGGGAGGVGEGYECAFLDSGGNGGARHECAMTSTDVIRVGDRCKAQRPIGPGHLRSERLRRKHPRGLPIRRSLRRSSR
jgi:hypothetical protein